jgi:hypothetical protein
MEKLSPARWPRWLLLVLGILLGVLVLLTIRLATYKPEHVHYHANFAVYLNGQRFPFKAAQYYQEVAICSSSHGITSPQQRAHMHDNVNDVVHVHDHAVTWGQFFNNFGWTIGPDLIETDNGTKYIADDTHKVHVLIDGQDYTDLTSVANIVIKDRSKLLLSYGDQDEQSLQKEFKTIASTAQKHDESKDPASCSGQEAVPFNERLHHLF